jgi:Peptidase family M23
MSRHRTTARGLFLLIVTLLVGAGAATAWSAQSTAAKVPQLVFPVLGEATFGSDFGDARGQGAHEGNDIIAPRRALALAAEAGTVKFWTTSSRAGCMLYLYGKSGTTYLYIHLNNDLTNGNDNRGRCVPGVAFTKGLRSGAKVAAGQPIAYVGDSGDADGIHPHLHFEVHPDDGRAVNPYPYLTKARRLLFAARPGSTFTLALTGTVVEAGSEGLRLELDRLRQWPGGRKVAQPGRAVEVAVPPTATIEGATEPNPNDPRELGLNLPAPGSTVTIFTAPAKATLAARTGAKNALAAKRVVVRK